jgi:hypothetical protein
MPTITSDLLMAFGEVILVIDRQRQIHHAVGDTNTVLTFTSDEITGLTWSQLLSAQADPAHMDGLYWTIEAAFEGYVQPQFLPKRLPFRDDLLAYLAMPDADHVAIQLRQSPIEKLDTLFYRDLRYALSSVRGFTGVLMKRISGPLTDIQEDDLQVVERDAQFASTLLDDWRNRFILPARCAPMPIHARTLLHLNMDALPKRRLATHGLTINYDLSPDVIVYSNGAIRLALIELIKSLPQYVMKQTPIKVSEQLKDDVLEVHLSYRAIHNSMKAAQKLIPVDLFERRSIKASSKIKTVLSSLHACLSPYGCSAWALATESMSLATIVMTVPIWRGPTEHS